ncbi:uncharacterized protein SCHCODRAFT_02633834 [Schizophyllum commune H4-8]|uniref:uncharacterized protein n=1 Tax=Schizophyllum commune (strain H4-8 / FGSC 9210) TaxID=578458 RepID=UPI00215DD6C5|nr:uncharacterized protein SCHCODRAFT_02633834 [Schizophyllum commune H4-8]KAI5889202.1 hypothetical protein SCHCODRAFT_02633834 [Schizophyllum commune H4-8]
MLQAPCSMFAATYLPSLSPLLYSSRAQGRDLPSLSQAAPIVRLHSPRFPLPHASCYASPARRRARLALTARGRRRLLCIGAERRRPIS